MSARLISGTLLGPYRIVAPLGSGGMGEVFKAHDSRLDRAVALKVLPDAVLRDPERVRRFVQEAKAASSLSHPNIVVIHDIGEATPRDEGASEPAPDSTPIHYIAMELVEGATLRQLLEEKATDLRTLLAYLAQAAEGLAKAHSAGIVHRDLKPENVMVTRDGYAKVLDFGLAKLTESAATGSALAAAPTALQEENTRDGAVLGTVGYMSPEQVQGKKVDHRADLFAFGCLLYEAAAGKKPFAGDSSVDVMHAILRERPQPVEELNPQAPRALVRTIRRCLAKEPEKRLQSMKDLALELHDMVEEWETLETPSGTVSSGTALSGSAPSGSAPSARGGIGRAGWIAIGAAAAVALGAAGIVLRSRTVPAPAAASSFQSMRISPLTSNGRVIDFALSPDGRYLAYLRIDPPGVSLWMRQVATGSDVQVLPARSADKPITSVRFTPDGDYLDYLRTTEDPHLPQNLWELHRIPTLGGAPRKIVSDIDTPPAYSPDGKQLTFVRQDPVHGVFTLYVAALDGSGERPLARRSSAKGSTFIANEWGLGPAWSPDGRQIAVPGSVLGRSMGAEIALVDVASGAESLVGSYTTRNLNGLAWAADGRSLLVTAKGSVDQAENQVWRVSAPDGAVSRLTNDLSDYSGVHLSADGKSLGTVQNSESSELWTMPLAQPGAPRPLTTGAQENFYDIDGADDGSLVASLKRGGERNLWRVSSSSGERVQLTHGSSAFDPQISSDGRVVVYLAPSQDGEVNLYAMDGDGANLRELGRKGGEDAPAISPDGRWVAFMTAERTGIWKQSAAGGEPTLLVDDQQAFGPRFSPDGTKLLYCTTRAALDHPEQGRNVLVVIPAEGGATLAEVDRPQAHFWRWAPDQNAALFLKLEGDGANIWRLPFDGKPAERLTRLASTLIFDFTLVDGGKSLVFSKGEVSSDAVLITNFQ